MRGWQRTVKQQSRALLQSYADKACRRWKVSPVRVQFGKAKNKSGVYKSDTQSISLFICAPFSGRNLPVLLHEVAHHIDDCVWDAAEAHGPIFAAIEMDLLDHYQVLPSNAFRVLAKEFGIKIARLRKRKPD